MCVSSTMLQAGAQIAQGVSDSNTAKANARLSMAEAASAENAGNYKAYQVGKQGEEVQAETTVAQASSGLDLSSGSPALVAAESAKNIKLDQLMAIGQGQQEAYADRVKAKIYKKQGTAALWNAGLSAGGTILSGAEKAASAGMGGG